MIMKSLIVCLFLLTASGKIRCQDISAQNANPEEISTAEQLQELKDELRAEFKSEIRSIKEELKQLITELHEEKSDGESEEAERKEREVNLDTLTGYCNEQVQSLLAQRSCYDWRIMGFHTSGFYLIDPDGKGIGEPPFSVYCDMTTGYAVVHHDTEKLRTVYPCSGPSCFTRGITYNATSKQIEALIMASDNCEQNIWIECLESPLNEGNESLSWWEDRHGNKQTYWAGDNPEASGCSCGLTDTCKQPGMLCNCDAAMSGKWLSDSGYIANTDHLPVNRLHFGSGDDNTKLQMAYELGPLQCYGYKGTSYPESCYDIWKSGIYTSGSYTIRTSDKVQQVYCNMTQILEDNYSPKETSSVVFYANLLKQAKQDNTVIFEDVYINIGNGYNVTDGSFTAPYDGIYEFHFYGQVSGYTRVQIKKNGGNANHAVWDADGSSTLSFSSILNLKSGDEVTVYLAAGLLAQWDAFGDRTTFSGKLITTNV